MASKPKASGGRSIGSIPKIPKIPKIPPIPPVQSVQSIRAVQPVQPIQPIPTIPHVPHIEGVQALEALAVRATSSARFRINARDGLRLRSGPDQSFPAVRTLPLGTVVSVTKREGAWAQVDLEGDGVADGFVHASFLESADGGASTPSSEVVAVGNDILDAVTPEMVKSIFPAATKLTNIRTHLPLVLDGLRAHGLVDKPMVLMALGTIRAETEGFEPISEFKSRFNTLNTPFDLYDAGTAIGQRLGNTERGDGPFFKGRGFIQLTGRSNYTVVGRQLGQPLATQPELANDPAVAGAILARFLKNKESAIRAAFAASNLALARKLVNGGSHGLDRFNDTVSRGMRALPG